MSAIITQPLGTYISVHNSDGTYDTFQFSEGDTFTGMKCAKWPNAVLSGKIVGVGVVRNNITIRNDTAWGDGRIVDPCPVVVSAGMAITPTTVTVEVDVDCVCGCPIRKGEILVVPVNDILEIATVTNNTKYLTPDDDLAAAVTAATKGQIIRLLPGEYKKDITIKAGIKIIGSGTDCTKITGTVTVTAGGDHVDIKDVAIEDEAAAETGLITITDNSGIFVDHCVLSLLEASGIDACALIKRDVVAAKVRSEISVQDSVLQIVGAEANDVNYGILVGETDGTDLGEADVHLINSHVVTTGSAVCCTARGPVEITALKSKLSGLTPVLVAHNGESTTSGVFETNFDGSVMKFNDCELSALQPNQASGDDPDENEAAAIAIQASKNLAADLRDIVININNVASTNKNAVFAPMRAVDINKTAACDGCCVKLRATKINIQNPTVTAFRCDGDTNCIDVNSSVVVYGVGPNGEVALLPNQI